MIVAYNYFISAICDHMDNIEPTERNSCEEELPSGHCLSGIVNRAAAAERIGTRSPARSAAGIRQRRWQARRAAPGRSGRRWMRIFDMRLDGGPVKWRGRAPVPRSAPMGATAPRPAPTGAMQTSSPAVAAHGRDVGRPGPTSGAHGAATFSAHGHRLRSRCQRPWAPRPALGPMVRARGARSRDRARGYGGR